MSSPTTTPAPTELATQIAVPLSPTPAPIPLSEAKLREILKRCSPGTYVAASEFRRTGNVALLPVLVHGIIERYVEREIRVKLGHGNDSLRLVEDLGLDSLTRMEIVLLAEEVLPISIDNEDLCHLRTLGDVKQRITELVSSLPAGALSGASRPPAATSSGRPASAATALFPAPQSPLVSR